MSRLMVKWPCKQVTDLVKSVQICSYFWFVFSRIQSECGKIRTWNNYVFGHFASLRIQSEYGKIRTKNNYVFGHFSRSVCFFLKGNFHGDFLSFCPSLFFSLSSLKLWKNFVIQKPSINLISQMIECLHGRNRKQFELWVGKRASGLWLLVRCCSNSINTDESVMHSTFRALYIVLTYFHILYVCLSGACFEVESHGFIELNTCRKEKLSKTFLWRKWAKGELLGLHYFTLGPWVICSTSWQMTNESL